ncbi:MAG: hypothetical protein ACFFD4_05395 [Candidatus Odinarchaeota archaeon]
MNATRLEEPEPEEVETIVLTCPICNHEISFTVTLEEMEKARKKTGILKKAINHDNRHVIVVHIDERCKVRRMYGYECTRIGPEAVPASKSSKRNVKSITLTNDSEKFLADDPDHFLKSLLDEMERISRN